MGMKLGDAAKQKGKRRSPDAWAVAFRQCFRSRHVRLIGHPMSGEQRNLRGQEAESQAGKGMGWLMPGDVVLDSHSLGPSSIRILPILQHLAEA